jgi:hypothetical protein
MHSHSSEYSYSRPFRRQVMSACNVLLGRVLIVSNIGSPTLQVVAEQRAEPDISVALLSGLAPLSYKHTLSYADIRVRIVQL